MCNYFFLIVNFSVQLHITVACTQITYKSIIDEFKLVYKCEKEEKKQKLTNIIKG